MNGRGGMCVFGHISRRDTTIPPEEEVRVVGLGQERGWRGAKPSFLFASLSKTA